MIRHYATIEEWLSLQPPGEDPIFKEILSVVEIFTKNIYKSYTIMDEHGIKHEVVQNVGVDVNTLEFYFEELYENRYLYANFPNLEELAKVKKKVQAVMSLNQPKYWKIIEDLGYDYNPFDNYSKKVRETAYLAGGDQTSTQTGSVDSGPGESPLTTSTYTTTYDDASTGRLNNYVEQTGTSTTTYNELENKIVQDSPFGAESTKTINSLDDPYGLGFDANKIDTYGGKALEESGRMGNIDLRKLIEDELDVQNMINLVKVIFKDLEPYIFLSTMKI